PDATVIVATIQALKRHGDGDLERGLPNLLRHVDTMTKVFGLNAVVAVNRFPADTDAEVELVRSRCAELGARAVVSEVWARGGKGGIDLAEEVVRLCDEPSQFHFSYELDQPLEAKIEAIARRVYHADGVAFTDQARADLSALTEHGFGGLPVCVAKTQYSFSDDPKLLGAPDGFTVTVRELRVSAGAGFVVALTGAIMTMPGLPKSPAATRIDVDADGVISGLF
ncbi:MAG: formate--tetrahydrofolate ligase, partial [Actinomycetia bacterium]|nr:formate--tetrahydrofolate ligase [Actinomycetes bacterium]